MAKRILILVGIPDFDYGNKHSAVRTFLWTVRRALEKEGHVVAFAGETDEKRASAVKGNGERLDRTEPAFKSFMKNGLKKWRWLYQSIAFRSYFKRQQNMIDQLKGEKPFDLVIEFHTVGSVVGKRLAEEWKCDFSVIFDSPVDEQFYEMHGTKTWHWKHIQHTEKETLEAADYLMVYSPACQKFLEKKYSLKADVSVLPCVVNKARIENNPPEKAFNITFIGSFLSWHKVDVLVKAFHRFSVNFPEARLQLIGYGVEWDQIKKRITQKKLTDKVDMPGFVSEEQLLVYKKDSHVAVMPGSNWYGSPLKLFEYAECRIPFIAPSSQTVSAIFEDGAHCLFIDPQREVDSLLEKLTFLHENPLKGKEMAKNAQQYVMKEYDEGVYGKKLVKALLNQD